MALLPSYKAQRVASESETGSIEEVPDELTPQVGIIADALAALGIARVGAAGCEADDVIGSYAAQAEMPVEVVTGDRDLFQVVDDARRVRVLYVARGVAKHEVVTGDVVREKYGIGPEQYADFATLRGDPSDGLPGVSGVGEKTAAALLAEFGDLAGILSAAPAMPPPPWRRDRAPRSLRPRTTSPSRRRSCRCDATWTLPRLARGAAAAVLRPTLRRWPAWWTAGGSAAPCGGSAAALGW